VEQETGAGGRHLLFKHNGTGIGNKHRGRAKFAPGYEAAVFLGR
jgi:hypothetical protein